MLRADRHGRMPYGWIKRSEKKRKCLGKSMAMNLFKKKSSAMTNEDEIKKIIAKNTWYHGWEIVPGIHTPGGCAFDPSHYFDVLGVPKNLEGLSVLDIGAYDGILSFEAEKRGAKQVVSADIQDPSRTGFNAAKRILGSEIEYKQISVYDLTKMFDQKFDYIFFCGVYYHLKHPILAFEEISRVSHETSQLFIEGECLLNYAETLAEDGIDATPLGNFADVPLTACYPGRYVGTENWFVPNVACVKGWLKCGGYELKNHSFINQRDNRVQRLFGRCERNLSLLSNVNSENGLITEHGLI